MPELETVAISSIYLKIVLDPISTYQEYLTTMNFLSTGSYNDGGHLAYRLRCRKGNKSRAHLAIGIREILNGRTLH